MARGMVHIPWYATFFRGDKFETALKVATEGAARYGATDYAVYRSRDDRYKFLQTVSFDSKLDWERYWNSQEMIDFREEFSGFYQVPVLYVWHDVVTEATGLTRHDPDAETTASVETEVGEGGEGVGVHRGESAAR